jgi:hypothetical protein
VGRHCPCRRKKASKKKRKAPPKKSWEQDESLDGLDLPDDSFDYDELIAKEFGEGKNHSKIGISRLWWITALILSIVWALFYLF